ncbi:MAG: hypothetical protein Q8K78_09175 [Planctomycetaceae bacterium]|nr:hypothetical protein [Planctomycetaceae bacterium]
MSDLTSLDDVQAQPLTETQIRGILAQIDLDITNLVRDGKLSALKYAIGGSGAPTADRSANLHALLTARQHYETLLRGLPVWEVSRGEDDSPATRG